jgi:hypothetical protein
VLADDNTQEGRLAAPVAKKGYRMEVAVIGWPAKIASLIEESGMFDSESVEKISEGDDWFVIVHLKEPVAENISLSETR